MNKTVTLDNSNKNKKTSNEESGALYKRWGSFSVSKLPADIDLTRLKQARMIVADEPPLLPFQVESIDRNTSAATTAAAAATATASAETFKTFDAAKVDGNDKAFRVTLQPSVDSYIINTIKLNRLLKQNVTFDRLTFPSKKKKKPSSSSYVSKISSDDEARFHLRRFAKIMLLHGGFDGNKTTNFCRARYVLGSLV